MHPRFQVRASCVSAPRTHFPCLKSLRSTHVPLQHVYYPIKHARRVNEAATWLHSLGGTCAFANNAGTRRAPVNAVAQNQRDAVIAAQAVRQEARGEPAGTHIARHNAEHVDAE